MTNIVATVGKTYAIYRLVMGLFVGIIVMSSGSSMMTMKKPLVSVDKKTGKKTETNPKIVGGSSLSLGLCAIGMGFAFYSFATSSNNAARLTALYGTANMTRKLMR